MQRRKFAALAAGATVAPLVLGSTAPVTAAPIAPPPIQPTRIMCVGDSITLGCDGTNGPIPTAYGGYRGHLLMQLWRDFDIRMVGPQTLPTFPINWGGHEGISGATLTSLLAVVPDAVEEYAPDIVLLMAGTNDLGSTLYTVDGGVLRARMLALLVAIDAARPRVQIIVGTIPPVRASVNPSGPGAISSYNANQLPLAVEDARLGGVQNVRLTGISDALTDTDMAADGGHPNDAGYIKMAAAWYDALTHAPALVRVA